MSAPGTTGGEEARPRPSDRLPWKVRLFAGALVAAIMGLYWQDLPLLERLEFVAYDREMRLLPPRSPSDKVIQVVVDEPSLERLGRWPWPRSVLADTVRRLSEDGARVIAFTMAFLEPDAAGTLRYAREVEQELDTHAVTEPTLRGRLRALTRDADTDGALATAIRESAAEVVLGYFFHLSPSELPAPLATGEVASRVSRLRSSAFSALHLPVGVARPPFLQAYAPQATLPELAGATEHAGFLQVPTDSDGRVRRADLIVEYDEVLYPSLAVQAAWAYLGLPEKAVFGSEYGAEGVALGSHFFHTDERGRTLVAYLGPPGSFPRYSLGDVVEGGFPPGTFRDKVVLIGTTAHGIADVLPTPMDGFHPAVEIHATLIDNLLEGRSLVRPTWYSGLDLLAILLVGGLATIFLGRLSAPVELATTVGAGAAYTMWTSWLFGSHGVALTKIFPLLALGLVYGYLTLSRYRLAESQRRQVEGTFGRYVAPRVMDAMLRQPELLRLGGDERIATVLFSDLKGFTAASEALGPTRMVELMCEYFEEMTALIYQQDGLLKEYVGDEIMAIFGAPLDQPDHAVRACRAALAMRDRLAALAVSWVEQGRPALRARWGINSGVMLVGNLGSSYRYSYGALGDNVNLGSRLEGLNGQYGTELMIGENTAALVGDAFVTREVDVVRVKGKLTGVRVFELVAPAGEPLDAARAACHEAYAEALRAYRTQDFRLALVHLEQAAGHREDGPTEVLRGRCEYFLEAPPGPGWDGVFEAKTK